MDIQLIIVSLLILAAVLYAGKFFWKKTGSMVLPSACADDCGCESKTKRRKTAH